MTDFARLLAALADAGVEFIVIGGFAATAHGSAHVTVDLDVVYRRTAENMIRMASALEHFVNLSTLIHLKRAAGRPKDIERIAELEALQQEQQSAGDWRTPDEI